MILFLQLLTLVSMFEALGFVQVHYFTVLEAFISNLIDDGVLYLRACNCSEDLNV